MHLERLGTTEVDGIEIGTVYVFPKLDGTNASIWLEDGELCAGSRNRKLSVDSDNAGFYNWALTQKNLKVMLQRNPNLSFYGEWLVPHSLKTYRDDAWRKFYIFDAYNHDTGMYIHYDGLKEILDAHNADYLAPLAIVKNGNYETFQGLLEKNVFLIQEGQGLGEGIVLKNYEWENKFGKGTSSSLTAVLVEKAANSASDGDLAELLGDNATVEGVTIVDDTTSGYDKAKAQADAIRNKKDKEFEFSDSDAPIDMSEIPF
jgi:ATP-dependent RNA circularization protein (DNA/RNA ligase family)